MARVNLPVCSPHCPFNAERQAGEAVNSNFKVIGLTRLGIKTLSTAPEADARTTRPSEPLIGTCYNFTINVVQWRYETVANRLVVREICGQLRRFESMRELSFISHSSETVNEHAVNTW